MKPFEERYTAWIDGKLSEAERADFEASLEDRTAAEADREDAQRVGELLRRHGPAPLTNGDFFNYQLMERIAADERRPAREGGRPSRFALPLPHLIWAAVCFLLLAFSLYKTLVPAIAPPTVPALRELAQNDPEPDWGYDAQVLEARPADPSISVTPLRSGPQQVSVLWLEGLDYLPASYELQ